MEVVARFRQIGNQPGCVRKEQTCLKCGISVDAQLRFSGAPMGVQIRNGELWGPWLCYNHGLEDIMKGVGYDPNAS